MISCVWPSLLSVLPLSYRLRAVVAFALAQNESCRAL